MEELRKDILAEKELILSTLASLDEALGREDSYRAGRYIYIYTKCI